MDWPSLLSRTLPIDPPPLLLAGLVFAAALVSIPTASWRYFGLFTTLVHELGHAFAAILTGRVVHGIRIRRDHSGDAVSSGRGRAGSIISGMFGYPAPAIVGAAQLWSVFNEYSALALFVGGAILVLTLLVVRNAVGALVVVLSAGVSAVLWFVATPSIQSYALLVIGIALMVGSVRGLGTVIGVHTRHRAQLRTSDAYLLSRRTHVPSFVWLLTFTAIIAGSIAFAIWSYLLR